MNINQFNENSECFLYVCVFLKENIYGANWK